MFRTAAVSAALLCAGLLASGTAGCAGYRAGTSLPSSIRSVHVPTFFNKSGEPNVEATVTGALIVELQRDGTLAIAGKGDADAILEVTLTALKLEPLRYSKDNATQTEEFRLILFADMVMREIATGKTVARGTGLKGKTTFIPAGDLSSAKKAAIPAAARDLAHSIVEGVVEAW